MDELPYVVFGIFEVVDYVGGVVVVAIALKEFFCELGISTLVFL